MWEVCAFPVPKEGALDLLSNAITVHDEPKNYQCLWYTHAKCTCTYMCVYPYTWWKPSSSCSGLVRYVEQLKREGLIMQSSQQPPPVVSCLLHYNVCNAMYHCMYMYMYMYQISMYTIFSCDTNNCVFHVRFLLCELKKKLQNFFAVNI